MRRRIFTVASALSLLLCVASMVLSEWNSDRISEYNEGLRFSRGYFVLQYSEDHWEVEYLPPHGNYVYLRFWLWPVMMATAIAPLIWLSRAEREYRKRRTSLCRKCSYDLTGNESGVCPECGTPVAGKVEAKT